MPDSPESDSVFDQIRAGRKGIVDAPGTWPAKRTLAEAVRNLTNCLCATDASEQEILAIAAQVDASAKRFSGQPVMQDLPGVAEMSLAGGMEFFIDRSPLVGLANPLAPPVRLTADPDEKVVHGTVTFGKAFEGAPGCVHGGFVAAVLDEALGMACIFSGNPGMTGRLTISYRKPTPIETELRVEARMDRIDGRKLYISGELFAGDLLLAESDGLFIQIAHEKFGELRDDQRRRETDRETGR